MSDAGARALRRAVCGLCGMVIYVTADALCHRCAESPEVAAARRSAVRVVGEYRDARIPAFRDDPGGPVVFWVGPNDEGCPDWYRRGDEVPSDFDFERWQVAVMYPQEG